MGKKVAVCCFFIVCCYNWLFSQSVQWVLLPKYSSVEIFTDKFYKVRETGKVGLIDLAGKEILPAMYDSITTFRDGYALVLNREAGKYAIKAIVDNLGKGVSFVQAQYFITKYQTFSEGKLPVSDVRGKYGFILPDGQTAIKCSFSEVHPFCDGRASVTLGLSDVVYIDDNGQLMGMEPGNIIFGSSFCNGEAVVFTMDRKGYVVDTSGRIVRNSNLKIESVRLRSIDYRMSDAVCPTAKEEISTKLLPNDGILPFQKDGLYGFQKGNLTILPAQFSAAQPFRNGYAIIKKDGKFGFLRYADGQFSVSTNTDVLKVRKHESEPVEFTISVPSFWKDSELTLRLTDQNGKTEDLKPSSSSNGTFSYSYTPSVSNKEKEMTYKATISGGGLILYESSKTVRFEYPEPKFIILSWTQKSKADEHDDCYISVTIKNDSEEAGTFPVSITGSRVRPVSEAITLGGGGSQKVSTIIPNVKKLGTVPVTIRLGNSVSIKTVSIVAIPFYWQ